MRGDTVFRVYGVHHGRADDVHFGTFATESEALATIATLESREHDGVNWARCYHDAGFVIRPAAVETDFDIPSLPKPRDRYVTRTTEAGGERSWRTSSVEVLRRVGAGSDVEKVCEYARNYRLLHTFEPFRQRGHDYALISRHYTSAAVLDLASGEVIAEESEPTPGGGFCPVGFYVPDWWDVNDGLIALQPAPCGTLRIGRKRAGLAPGGRGEHQAERERDGARAPKLRGHRGHLHRVPTSGSVCPGFPPSFTSS